MTNQYQNEVLFDFLSFQLCLYQICLIRLGSAPFCCFVSLFINWVDLESITIDLVPRGPSCSLGFWIVTDLLRFESADHVILMGFQE